jgi:hypothetical protein
MTSYVQTIECESNSKAYVNEPSVSNLFQFTDDDPILQTRENCPTSSSPSPSSPPSPPSVSPTFGHNISRSSSQSESQSLACDIGSDYSPSDDDDDGDDDDDDGDGEDDLESENRSGRDDGSQASDIHNKYQRDMWILDIHGLISNIASTQTTEIQKIDFLKKIIEEEIYHRVACDEKAKSESKYNN